MNYKDLTVREYVQEEYLYRFSAIEKVLNETFTEIGFVNDWRVYVDRKYRANWQSIPEDTRLVIYIQAQAQAESEEWE